MKLRAGRKPRPVSEYNQCFMKDILLVFLGAAFSYLATFILEKQRHKETEKECQRAYLLKVRLGLQSLSSSLKS